MIRDTDTGGRFGFKLTKAEVVKKSAIRNKDDMKRVVLCVMKAIQEKKSSVHDSLEINY